MYSALVTVSSILLVAFGGILYTFGVQLIPIQSAINVVHLPLLALLLGGIVLLNRVRRNLVESLLSFALSLRTWSTDRGFRDDPGLQLQPFLVPLFFLALWGVIYSLLLVLGLGLSPEGFLAQPAAVLLSLCLIVVDRELWRICRRAYERSLFRSTGGAA